MAKKLEHSLDISTFGFRSVIDSGNTIALDQAQMPWLVGSKRHARLATVELYSGETIFLGSAIRDKLLQGVPESAHQICSDKAFYQTVTLAHQMLPGVMIIPGKKRPPIYHRQIIESRAGSGRHPAATKDNAPIIYVMKLEPAVGRSYPTYLRVAIGESRNHAATVKKLKY